MAIGFLSGAEREPLDGFPAQIVPRDIETNFTPSRVSLAWTAVRGCMTS